MVTLRTPISKVSIELEQSSRWWGCKWPPMSQTRFMKIRPMAHYVFGAAEGHAWTDGRTHTDGGITKSCANLPHHKTEIQNVWGKKLLIWDQFQITDRTTTPHILSIRWWTKQVSVPALEKYVRIGRSSSWETTRETKWLSQLETVTTHIQTCLPETIPETCYFCHPHL